MVEIHNGAIGPEFPSDFLAGNDLAVPLNQHSENLEWLFSKSDLLISINRRTQFIRLEVKLKISDSHAT
jgi:hypothetical protein